MRSKVITRREALASGAALAAVSATRARAQARFEKPKLNFALSVDASSFLPAYVANARTWKEQGLDVQFNIFRNDAEAAQALAGDSVDVTLQSFDGLVSLINAGQPAWGFYAGFAQADFEWFSLASIKTWDQLRGQTVGVSSFGSLTDQVTRYALRKHGLDPEKDVQIRQIGPSSAALAALKSGRLGAGVLSAPFKWTAMDSGLTRLGVQSQELSPQWPKHTFIAKRDFLDRNPNLLKALLRAHVAAIRLARADKAFAAKVLEDRLKFSPEHALRAYDDVIAGFDEKGTIPDMSVFWQIKVEAKDVTAPWPREKFFDDRFVRTFSEWAP
jgi:NitT/TauT family transport system substrate-binding protein